MGKDRDFNLNFIIPDSNTTPNKNIKIFSFNEKKNFLAGGKPVPSLPLARQLPVALMRTAVDSFGPDVIAELDKKAGHQVTDPLLENIRPSEEPTLGMVLAHFVESGERLISDHAAITKEAEGLVLLSAMPKESLVMLRAALAPLKALLSSHSPLLNQSTDRPIHVPPYVHEALETVQLLLPILETQVKKLQQQFVDGKLREYARLRGMSLDELISRRGEFHPDRCMSRTQAEKQFNAHMFAILNHYAEKRSLERDTARKKKLAEAYARDLRYAKTHAAGKKAAMPRLPCALVRVRFA